MNEQKNDSRFITSPANKLKRSACGFTYIELLIAVTISAMLMTSIMIFTGSALSKNSRNHKMLQLSNSNFTFEQKLFDSIGNISGSGIIKSGGSFGSYGTGIFLSVDDSGTPISFIGLKTSTGYCDGIPNAAESGNIKRLVIRGLSSGNTHDATAGGYYINGDSIEKASNTVIGTGNGGNTLDEANPRKTELDDPNAIIESAGYLYIADTGNDRILSYDIANDKITILLDAMDGMRSPQDLHMSSGILYIANTGKGEILSIRDGDGNNGMSPIIAIKTTKDIRFDSVKMRFGGIANVSSPISASDFIFSGIVPSAGDMVSTGAELIYTFTGGLKSINKGIQHTIGISDLWPVPVAAGNHPVRVIFMSGSEDVYDTRSSYLVVGDGSLFDRKGNVVGLVASGIAYPHRLIGPSSWETDIADWTTLLMDGKSETIESELPIKDFSYSLDGNALTIKYDYYKYFDCVNSKHIIKERLIKKSIR